MAEKKIRIGIIGSRGRMGQLIQQEACKDHEVIYKPQWVLDRCSNQGIHALKEFFSAIDVAIDFSSPSAVPYYLPKMLSAQKSLVIGTTALQTQEQSLINDAAKQMPIFYAANFSLGMSLLRKTAQIIATSGPLHSIEISEIHHQHKADKPSGSALALQQLLSQYHDRVSIQSEREGDHPGKHTIVFGLPGEKITITHEVIDRKIFALGALRAAKWLLDRPAKIYGMDDLL